MKNKNLLICFLGSVLTTISITACNMPLTENNHKTTTLACPMSQPLPTISFTEDTTLQQAVDEFNALVASENLWGAFVVDPAVVQSSIRREYARLDQSMRPDADSILNGTFPVHASFVHYSGDTCSKAKSFRVRLELNYTAAELGIPNAPGYAAGGGYAFRIGDDTIAGPDGNPQPEPFPTPTSHPQPTPSSSPQN